MKLLRPTWKRIDPNKTYTFKNIPPKIPRESRECCSDILQKLFNNTFSNKKFPDELKPADRYKKDGPNKSKNSRPLVLNWYFYLHLRH